MTKYRGSFHMKVSIPTPNFLPSVCCAIEKHSTMLWNLTSPFLMSLSILWRLWYIEQCSYQWASAAGKRSFQHAPRVLDIRMNSASNAAKGLYDFVPFDVLPLSWYATLTVRTFEHIEMLASTFGRQSNTSSDGSELTTGLQLRYLYLKIEPTLQKAANQITFGYFVKRHHERDLPIDVFHRL